METARHHQDNGEFQAAIDEYLALLEAEPGEDLARRASYHLAETYLMSRSYDAAAEAWEEYISRHGDDDRLPQVWLMAAQAHRNANQCDAAIPHLETYLQSDGLLVDVAAEWLGDCYAVSDTADDWDRAIAAYQLGLAEAEDKGVQVGLREKIAGIHLGRQDYPAAIDEYDAILDVARIASYRSRIEYQAGQALAAQGRRDEAHARYRKAIDADPMAEYAYLALVALIDAGVEVDQLQRGLVDYYAGKNYPDAYGAAIRAFDSYLASDSPEQADKALLYRALSQRAYDQTEQALESLEALIVGYPDSSLLARAWMEKGATLSWAGDAGAAIKIYQDVAAFFPGDEQAPEALWRAAGLEAQQGNLREAAKIFERVQAAFPAYDKAAQALWEAGLLQYRAADNASAARVWSFLVEKYPTSSFAPKTRYWLGKVSAAKEPHWDDLVARSPASYYALRVNQIRSGESLTATRLITLPVTPRAWDPQEVEVELLRWLATWTEVPTDTTLSKVPDAWRARTGYQRGEALLEAGMRSQALGAYDTVRAAAWNKPLVLAQLAIDFHQKGMYGLSARCAYRLAVLWPDGVIGEAPPGLQYLAYPLPYADLISSEALDRDLDPLLLAALIRQESLFEPVAESYAGARGLGQVMPATGEGIARSLALTEFSVDDLYRPVVSIRFGAYYLRVQLTYFDQQLLVALAAYNGGPGNTIRWLEAGEGDLDLFVEMITATQSRQYLQRVYQQYLIYERLYRTNDGPETS